MQGADVRSEGCEGCRGGVRGAGCRCEECGVHGAEVRSVGVQGADVRM